MTASDYAQPTSPRGNSGGGEPTPTSPPDAGPASIGAAAPLPSSESVSSDRNTSMQPESAENASVNAAKPSLVNGPSTVQVFGSTVAASANEGATAIQNQSGGTGRCTDWLWV